MSRPRVLTVISCGGTKQDLETGEAVPARELYTSSVQVCKDRYGLHSDAYFIMSAKYGLVHNQTELPHYDRSIDDLSEIQVKAWARGVAEDLKRILDRENFDAVVFIGAKSYVEPLERHFGRLPVAVLTPWQTCDRVRGNGLGAQWCNDESNWPENVSSPEEIETVVSEPVSGLQRWVA